MMTLYDKGKKAFHPYTDFLADNEENVTTMTSQLKGLKITPKKPWGGFLPFTLNRLERDLHADDATQF